jgi:hypothetical protein
MTTYRNIALAVVVTLVLATRTPLGNLIGGV